MTDYTKTTDFAAKDTLPSGDSNKVIRGTEFDTEFNNIATASATKADLSNPNFQGDVSVAGNISVSGTVDGRDVAADGTKLDTVETNADVTDTANVTAAGAVMDSELTDEAAVKALDQGVATTDSPTFAGATLGAVTYAATDGTDGQVLTTDGAGNATFEALPDSLYLNVKDFGATGDGSTDDTTAIQNAINAASQSDAATNGIQTIFFPDGHYKFSTLYFYYDLTLNPGFENTENRDGRFQIRGTGRLSINDLKNYDGTNTDRLYGAVLESTGDGIILTESTSQQAQNFVAKDLTIIANNNGHILKTSYSPGLTFDHCAFKQLNPVGNGLQCQNTWWFMMNQCYVFGATSSGSPAANTGYGVEFGVSTLAGEFTMIGSLIDAWQDGLVYNSNSLSVNFSIRDSGFQNMNRYGIYVYDGTLVQLLLDNVYFENQANQADVGQGVSYIKDNNENDIPAAALGRIRNLRMNSCFFLGGHGPANLSTITGPMIDLDLIDVLQIEACFVFRPFNVFLNVTDTINAQDTCGEIKNCLFQQDRDVTAEPTIFLLTGILPNVHNCVWPGYEDGLFDTTNDIQLFDSTTDGQYLREYTDPIMGSTNISKFSFGDSNVETVTSNPYIINDATNKEAKTYFDLTHNLPLGLQVRLPDRAEKNDGRLIVIKNNEATTSTQAFPYINVVNNTNQTTTIARLSPGQAGLFVFDGKKPKVKINATASQQNFIFDFETSSSSDLRVTKNGVEIDEGTDPNDYSVTLNADQTTNPGGTVTLVTPADENNELKIAIKGLFKYVGRTFHDNVILTDDDKILLGRGARTIETFTPATPETQFTYTFDSPDIAAQIIVERKLSGGSFVRTFDFTVNLSTKLVTLDTATASGEEVKISKYVGDMEIYHDSTSGESRIDTLAGLTLDGLTYPTTDGSANQVLTTDGSGTLSFANVSGIGINAVVDDTQPQLGGDLESNGHDILFADNDKAVFGASSDLQIYHDGSNSYVQDSGTGDLWLAGTQVRIANAAGNKTNLYSVDGAQVSIRYNGAEKLATTATGIDVTGTVTANDLTLSDTSPVLTLSDSDGTNQTMTFRESAGASFIDVRNGSGFGTFNLRRLNGTQTLRTMQILTSGDVALYANDGTTQGFYWDASASRLGLGETNPAHELHIKSASPQFRLEDSGGTSTYGDMQFNGTALALITRGGASSHGSIRLRSTDGTDTLSRVDILSNGDIKFFDDTGTEGLRWDASTSRLGLGTTLPATNLELSSNANGQATGDIPTVRLTNSDTTAVATDITGSFEFYSKDASSADYISGFVRNVAEDAGVNYAVTFGTKSGNSNATERMRINATGVGIGTDLPAEELHINASVPTIRLQDSDGTGQYSNILHSNGLLFLYARNGSSYGTFNFVGDNGTSQDTFSQITENAIQQFNSSAWYIRNRVDGGSLNLGVETSAGSLYYPVQMNGTSDILVFNNASSELARFTTSKDLLIGKATAAVGTAGLKISSTGSMTASIASGNAYNVYDTTNSAYRFYVSSAGQINATSTSITAISDESLKENIRDLDKGLDTVLGLQPRRFDWKNGDGNDIMGFVAQEVEEVMPELVHDYQYSETETKLGLKMGDMVPTLVKAIQDQQEIIDNLKSRIEQLEGVN